MSYNRFLSIFLFCIGITTLTTSCNDIKDPFTDEYPIKSSITEGGYQIVLATTDLAVGEDPNESTIGCAFPISDTHTIVNGEFAKRNPAVIEFLTNYYVDAKPLAEAEAYKAEAEVEWVDVAVKYLRENEDVWSTWITDDNSAEIIANVKEQLAREDATK